MSANDSSKPLYIQYTIVSVRKDEQYDAYLVKAEGPMGARISWFSTTRPKYAPGDKFAVKFDRKPVNNRVGSGSWGC